MSVARNEITPVDPLIAEQVNNFVTLRMSQAVGLWKAGREPEAMQLMEQTVDQLAAEAVAAQSVVIEDVLEMMDDAHGIGTANARAILRALTGQIKLSKGLRRFIIDILREA